MFENWQSEFLRLLWQVFGLSVLWAVGSPQSKEGDERKEAKIDLLMDHVLGEKEAARRRKELEQRYPSQ
ncbi:MAG TPA: DUF6766 family protein [Candidatus Thermoplasmatota archaeon]|nr:DUF6766 family protein [Candidatus Thermoplasmatota archaeon]